MLPSCEEVGQMVSESLDRRLSLPERIQVKLHLAMCALCRRYASQLVFLHKALHRHAEDAEARKEPDRELPDSVRQHLQDLVNRESQA
ncbi:zf-HC2 domain-containing protein [candidate division GN15 bacterium]|nr:zf-HC2 domain-containing protein [candidate division GN15 bacterium]